MSRNFGHARAERPDSVNVRPVTKHQTSDLYDVEFPCEVPFRRLDDSEKLTLGQRIILFGCIGAAGFFGLMVAYGYYLELLKP